MDLIARVPPSYTHLLPMDFTGILSPGPNIGNYTSTFAGSTVTANSTVNDTLARAAQAPFISYTDEFSNLLGVKPTITLVADRPGENFAFEGTVWIPQRSEVWFTSAIYNPPGYLSILHLDTGAVTRPNVTAGWKNFQRGVCDAEDDVVYFAAYRDNETFPGGVVAIDPETYDVRPLFNSYFGLPFAGLSDVTLVPGCGDDLSKYLFVSDTAGFIDSGYQSPPPVQVYNALYRYDLGRDELRPVISRIEQPGLLAVKVAPDQRTLFANDIGPFNTGIPSVQTIWKYDLDDEMQPVNRRLFAVPRFFVDGLQIDDAGRVWTAEADGLMVRDAHGRLLGVFNKRYFGRDVQLANVGLAGDVVVVLGLDRLSTVQLAQVVVASTSRHSFGRRHAWL